MNFFKRAIRYCWRQKIRSLILLLTFTLLASTALIALSVGRASEQGAANVKETVGGSIHIDLDSNKENFGSGTQNQWGTTYQYNGDFITDEMITAISKVSGVVNCNAEREGGYWGAAVDFEYFPSMFNISYTEFGAAAPYDVTLNSELDTNFLNGTYTLEKGRHITADDSYAVMISKELADKNGLSVGDSITLYSLDVDAQNTFKIVGIFSGTEGTTKEAITLDQIPANHGYMDLKSYNEIFGTSTKLGSLDVYVNSAENSQQVLEAIKELPELKNKTFTFEINNENFNLISNPLSSLQKLVDTAVSMIALISAAIVTLLLILWTRSRKKEVGILLAVGRSKGEIIGQFLTENLLLAFLSFAASGALAILLANKIGAFLVSKTTSGVSELAVTVSISDIATVFGIGVLILCFAVAVASYTIIRLKPKNILSKMS